MLHVTCKAYAPCTTTNNIVSLIKFKVMQYFEVMAISGSGIAGYKVKFSNEKQWEIKSVMKNVVKNVIKNEKVTPEEMKEAILDLASIVCDLAVIEPAELDAKTSENTSSFRNYFTKPAENPETPKKEESKDSSCESNTNEFGLQ